MPSPAPSAARPLRIGAYARRAGARKHGPPGSPLLIALRQWLAERRARQLGESFRTTSNGQAFAAYAAMSPQLFAGINARQAWANWQVIPKTLHGRAPCMPLVALDLACGDGASTAALAYHLPPGSRVLGLEYAPQLVRQAQSRRYRHANGQAATVSIIEASILEAFTDAQGQQLAPGSVHWINCCGALAHHFNAADLHLIARECARVLAPGGWAAVDARQAAIGDAVVDAFRACGLELQGYEKSCPIDRYPQCCLRQGDEG